MDNLISVENLVVEYKTSDLNGSKTVRAVDDISFDIKKGEILAVAGESGCGKSTLAKTLIKLQNPASGKIIYPDDWKKKDFCKKVQMVFQNPFASLNPKMKIKDILKEPLDINTKFSKEEKENLILETIEKVGLKKEHLDQYPHEFSGGQRQRIAIARALILKPELLIADEPVSALDVSIQAQIINLLKDLKNEFNLTIIFISHDLGVVKYIADRTIVMYLGEIVETGTKEEIFESPKHPYTKELLDSVPDRNKTFKFGIKDINYEDTVYACKFYPRCGNSYDCCKNVSPKYSSVSETHRIKCHIFDYAEREKNKTAD